MLTLVPIYTAVRLNAGRWAAHNQLAINLTFFSFNRNSGLCGAISVPTNYAWQSSFRADALAVIHDTMLVLAMTTNVYQHDERSEVG